MTFIAPMGTYRHWQYSAQPYGIKTYWRAMIRPGVGGEWRQISILADDEADAIRLARECIDYEYRVEVFEFLNGRKYDPMTDGNLPPNE